MGKVTSVQKAQKPRLLHMALVFAIITFVSLCLSGGLSVGQAHASILSVASSSAYKVTSVTAKERTAYNRAVKACMDYANQPNPIEVDMSDLKLSKKQATNVWSMIHANGELFWINCYDDTFTKDKFSLPCYYDDKTIDTMRVKFEKCIAKALKRVGPGMNAATKVHMLHDYVIDRVDYTEKNKNAYTALVNKKGDCFGFTLAMDVLLRRCGFSVDVAFNEKLDHSWNLVKVSGKWYHVDTTWDNGYTGQRYTKTFNWKKRRCHLYLLQSDSSMRSRTVDPNSSSYIQSHAGWTCHHKCTSKKYDFSRDQNKGFYNHCKDYKHIVRKFTKSGIKYRVTGVKKVKAVNATNHPKKVTYKGITYRVVGTTTS